MSTTPSGIGESLGDLEAAALITGEDVLQRDTIPDENQKITCFSCDQQMVGLYCHACGQRNDDYRRSIFALVMETLASVFSLENRIWRTWLSLIVRPGRASREFADGKRTIWTSPVRIYLAMSIILFGYMSVTETRIFSVRSDIVPKAGIIGAVEDLDNPSVKLKPDFGFFRRQAELDRLNADVDFDRVSELMNGIPKQVFVYNNNPTLLGVPLDDESLKSYGAWPENNDLDDLENMDDLNDDISNPDETIPTLREAALSEYSNSIDDAVDVYNDILGLTQSAETIGDRILAAKESGIQFNVIDALNPAMDEKGKTAAKEALAILDSKLTNLGISREVVHKLPLETKQGYSFNVGEGQIGNLKLSQNDVRRLFVQVLRDPSVLNEGVSRYLPRIMFLMMPFAALIGIVFIRGRRNALLYDHLVHAAYIHAVTFGFLIILILLAQWTPISGSMNVFLIGIMIYLPLSAKGMFGRGWFKTIFASYGIAFIYALVMFIVVAILTVNSISKAYQAVQF